MLAVEKIENAAAQSPDVLNHNLIEHFPNFAQFNSTKELENSAIYQKLKPEIETVLNAIVGENFASPVFVKNDTIRALAWNIERGKELDGIIETLKTHSDLRDRELLLLTELDYGMARSANRFVAREIAEKLKLNYVFAPCYIALNKGNGVEENAPGENQQAIHGLALFSRFPIRNASAVRLPNGADKMRGNEKRLGSLRALVCEIEHPAGNFFAATLHLDAHSSRRHRRRQMHILIDYLDNLMPGLPVLIGGDWNTTTHNSQNSTRAIMGYWRRVLMGPRNAALNHYPQPQRFFERDLFQLLKQRNFDYETLNDIGAGTLHYEVDSLTKNTMLADLIPQWCFPWIFWAMKKVGNSFSLHLDWFAGRGIKAADNFKPKVVGSLRDENGAALSDHDAIVLDFNLIK